MAGGGMLLHATKLSMTPQERGAAAETQVLRMLIGQGWQLLDRNWRCRWGELDLC